MVAILCSPPGEERKVQKQFELLSEWVSKDRGEKVLRTARKMKSVGTLFAQNCVLNAHIDSYSGTYTPEEVSQHAATLRSQFSNVSLRFYDITIDFPEEGTANVIVTARLTGTSTTGDRVDDTHELKCTLKHIDDKWLFTQVEVVEVLRR
jgi:hypothetical protein